MLADTDRQTDRQADRLTDMVITILRLPYQRRRNKVIRRHQTFRIIIIIMPNAYTAPQHCFDHGLLLFR